ncbi:peroxiredoxin-1-like [Hemiscyllium ocellatum]|uniref:peroxiredoxin-1-like n=1 Tax=Hemiscyllium ocellatum TaxID=170820 RepID=UPI0029668499|nr:peroxiredoxin-1-like [Hemiscyllium ocellatum]
MTAGKATIGKLAPDFEATAVMPNGQFEQLKLSKYRGKYVVFFFYPLDFSYVCPTEIIAFSDRIEDFNKINCEIIAASTDSHFAHLAWINTPRKQGGLGPTKVPLVSDLRRTICVDYGVLKDDEGIAFRGLYIIDNTGILRQIMINDLPVGRSVDEVMRLVQAFQFTDEHGEVCPANWKPGADTITPDVEKSKNYFTKQK